MLARAPLTAWFRVKSRFCFLHIVLSFSCALLAAAAAAAGDAADMRHIIIVRFPTAPPPHDSQTILSESMGIPNYPIGAGSTRFKKGILGQVTLGGEDITDAGDAGWTMRKGLLGEALRISRPEFSSRVDWRQLAGSRERPVRPATWLRAPFGTPWEVARARPVFGPVAVLLNLTGLGRGHAFVNGHDIGRYWCVRSTATPPLLQQQRSSMLMLAAVL